MAEARNPGGNVPLEEQQRFVCETLASRASTLCDLLRQLSQCSGLEQEASTLADAALVIACNIGALADDAARPGGEVLGDFNVWNYGPGFVDVRKEARHG